MGGFLTAGQLAVVFFVTGFGLGVLLAQRLKDWWNRVPAPLRNEMAALEKGLQSKMEIELHAAMSQVRASAGVPNPVVAPPVSPVVTP